MSLSQTTSIKLLALDLDGTIVNAQMQISRRVRQAIHGAMAMGVRVTLASGRVFPIMRTFAEDLSVRGPLICFQGALVQDSVSAKILFRLGVPLALAQEVVDVAHEQHWDLCLYVDDSRLYVEHMTPLLRYYAEYAPAKETMYPVGDLRRFLTSDPLKLLISTDEEHADQVRALLQQRFSGRLRVVRSFRRFVEITHPAASKNQALAFLARELGIEREETMAIGDYDNDADMVAWAGLGVAMGNGSDLTKSVARYIAPSIEQDGAAEAIERWILWAPHV